MAINLCLDFGNTSCKAMVFNDFVLVDKFGFSEEKAKQAVEDILTTYKPDAAILSSVIDHDSAIEELLNSHCKKVVILDRDTNLPIVNAYGSPETLGMDRLALAVAAQHYFPGKNALVISMGSAITYNYVTDRKFFRGGAISPGLDMRFKAMNTFTDKLPLVNENGNAPALGYDTESSIRSGVVHGIIGELDHFIELFRTYSDNFVVILTGGNAGFFENKLKNQIFADSQFLLKGLNIILRHNA